MNLRLMTIDDYAELVRLWEPEGMTPDFPTFTKCLARNPETCFVDDEGGRIAAAAMGLYDGRRGFIQSVVVREDCRRRGLGARIVRRTAEALKGEGADRIRLFVYKKNSDVLGFYESLGFAVEEGVHYLYEKSGIPV